MYEIKSIGGKTLYVAKNAANIRAALEEAVKNDAYLGGAYLGGANLGGANLGGANLRGANLGDAYLGEKLWMQVASVFRLSLNAMNDGGRHWIKGSLQIYLEDGSSAYCSMGSIQAHSEGTVCALAKWLLTSVCGGSIEAFNDFDRTTWEDVQAVFSVAILHAERFASEQNSK